MKNYLKIFILSFFIINPAFSFEKVYVFCTNGKTEWRWLTDDNQNYIEVEGEWQVKSMLIDKNSKILIYKYFLLKNGIKEVEYMSEKCIKNFGDEYLIPQPANSIFNAWFLFAIDNETLVGGRGDFKLTLTQTIPWINTVYSIYTKNKLILFLKHDDIKNLINNK